MQGKLNVTSWSLLDSKPCSLHKPIIKTKNVTIQLFENKHFDDIRVIQCKIKVRRTVRRCSFWNYLEPVENGLQEYLIDVSHESCKRIQETKTFNYDSSHSVVDLQWNGTVSRGMYLAGNAVDGACNVGAFSDRYGAWAAVNVEALLTISLSDYTASVDLVKNKIVLRSGVVCNFNDFKCIDSDGGFTFWESTKNHDCIDDKYNLVYEGPASEVKSKKSGIFETLYIVNNDKHLFSIMSNGETSDCGSSFIRTEHSLLFIKLVNNLSYKSINIKYPDLFTYFNNKNLVVQRNLDNKIENVYYDLLEKRCEILKQEMSQQLILAQLSPDLFAYNIIGSPGYLGVRSGESIHVIKCVPVEVEIINDLNICYEQLPVRWKDEIWFLTPVTRIITKRGTQISCTGILPTNFKINDRWMSINPRPVLVKSPKSLEADLEDDVKFQSINNLGTAGIYSSEDMENFLNKIMFPMERQSILNDVARSINNEPVHDYQGFQNLISENLLESMLTKKLNFLWTKAQIFGQFSSGFIAILMIFSTVKMIIETLVRGYTLHKIFGFSFKLLGEIFSSVTHLFTVNEYKTKVNNRECMCNKNLNSDSCSSRSNVVV